MLKVSHQIIDDNKTTLKRINLVLFLLKVSQIFDNIGKVPQKLFSGHDLRLNKGKISKNASGKPLLFCAIKWWTQKVQQLDGKMCFQ